MIDNVQADKIPVGVSSCLLGEKVRFDGTAKRNGFITDELSKVFDFHPFCPEVAIGLGIPRPTIRLVGHNGQISARGSRDDTIDVTTLLEDSAERQKSKHQQLCGYIVKKDSPSCGMERVKVYHHANPTREGTGIFTKRLMENFPHMPVEEEGRLNDANLRACFIQRVYIYHRWQKLLKDNPSWSSVVRFHAQHKYIFMSRQQLLAKKLGNWLAQSNKMETEQLCQQYLEQMTELLKTRATTSKHVYTLSHIQGYLKKHICAEDKSELVEMIDQYRLGNIPLVVPVTMLKHHFKHHPNAYIADSFYLTPYPDQLKLLNHI